MVTKEIVLVVVVVLVMVAVMMMAVMLASLAREKWGDNFLCL